MWARIFHSPSWARARPAIRNEALKRTGTTEVPKSCFIGTRDAIFRTGSEAIFELVNAFIWSPLQVRSGLWRRTGGQVLPPGFRGFLGGNPGILGRRRRRGFGWWRKLGRIFLRQLAGRLGIRSAGLRRRPDDFVVYELIAVRVHPLTVHVYPAVGRFNQTVPSCRGVRRVFGWGLRPEVGPP